MNTFPWLETNLFAPSCNQPASNGSTGLHNKLIAIANDSLSNGNVVYV